MSCSCAALAALHQALVEALERGTAPDGRPVARQVLLALADRTIELFESSVQVCATSCGVSALDIEDQLEMFAMLGYCDRNR